MTCTKPGPIQTDAFERSIDPWFDKKLVGVSGSCRNQSEQAVASSPDKKTQIRAFRRTPSSLPVQRGKGATMTGDYKPHGTTNLFAAWNLAFGLVISLRRHSRRSGAPVCPEIQRRDVARMAQHCVQRGADSSIQFLG